MKRRRYDTTGLVEDLHRERRNAMLLALGGVGLLIAVLLIYIFAIGGSDETTNADGQPDATATHEQPGETSPADPAASSDETGDQPAVETETETETEVEDAAPATIRLVLTKKAPVWVDGKSLGRIKKSQIQLTPGKHQIKAKLGRKMVTQTVVPKAGATYELRFNARRKKAQLKKVGN